VLNVLFEKEILKYLVALEIGGGVVARSLFIILSQTVVVTGSHINFITGGVLLTLKKLRKKN